MSAFITIQSGIAAGTSHHIVSRVVRVGSDPQSDVCLPTAEIPGHALTLEFDENSCRVYNRCRNNVHIGDQMIEPDQVATWPENDVLQLGEDIELLLDFEDPRSQGTSADFYTEFDDETDFVEEFSASAEPESEKPSSGSARTMMQLTVTLLCIVGCALLLLRDQNRKTGPESGPGFSQIVSNAIENPEVSRELIQRLQHAEALRVRGRQEMAREEYQSIRNDLVASKIRSTFNDTSNPLASQILQFIQTRLESDLR